MTSSDPSVIGKAPIGKEDHYIRIKLVFKERYTDALEKDSVLSILLQDESGASLVCEDSLFRYNDTLQNWLYYNSKQGDMSATWSFLAPEGARSIQLSVQDWAARQNGRTGLQGRVGECIVETSSRDFDTDLTNVTPSNPINVDGIVKTFDVESGRRYSLKWDVRSSKEEALFRVDFKSRSGNSLLPSEDFPINPTVGPYVYAARRAAPEQSGIVMHHDKEFEAPDSAAQMVLIGTAWSAGSTELISEIILDEITNAGASQAESQAEWLEEITRDDNILVLYTTAGPLSENNRLLLRSNRLALDCAQHGWKVLLVPFRQVDGVASPYRPHPNVLQISGDDMHEVVNRLCQRDLSGARVFVCSSRTDLLSIGIQNRLQDRGWRTVYETRDDMEEFQRVGLSKWYRPALEQWFATQADGIIATAPRLKDRISAITGRDDVVRIPNAGPDATLDLAAPLRTIENFREERSRPIAGYLGHLTAAWFDWQNLTRVISSNPEVKFEIIGPGVPANIYLPSNVEVYGELPHEEAIEVIKRWRVGLIPFIPSRLTYGVDPNKVYEYISFGLRTVSAPMGDVEHMPGVVTYRDFKSFNAKFREAIEYVPTEEFYAECQLFVEHSRWSARAEEFRTYLEGLK